MTRRIRVLIVDDSITIRRVLSDLVSSQADLELVGVAPNGRTALAKIPWIRPDVVALHLEMPELGELEVLSALRRTHPRLPVVMFSSLAERVSGALLQALALGTSDYVAKPLEPLALVDTIESVREVLVPKLRYFGAIAAGLEPGRFGSVASASGAAQGPLTRSLDPRLRPGASASPLISAPVNNRIDVVAIGCSTGGPNALAEIFAKLPPDLPVPIIIVQHMPPLFTRILAERLASRAGFSVREARNGDVLTKGGALIAPGDFHVGLHRDKARISVRVHQETPEHGCRPSVDVMLRAVASMFGSRSLTVILTGMGQDGLAGCRELRELGGQIIVQDEPSSVVWGMPGVVAKAGLADAVLPLDLVAREIVRRTSNRSSLLATTSTRRGGGTVNHG